MDKKSRSFLLWEPLGRPPLRSPGKLTSTQLFFLTFMCANAALAKRRGTRTTEVVVEAETAATRAVARDDARAKDISNNNN